MFIFLIASLIASAVAKDELIYWLSSNQAEKIFITTVDDLIVNDLCAKEKNQCFSALEHALTKGSSVKKDKSQAGNPASLFCLHVQGENVILEDSKKNEYDYCKISNKYFIDSWRLYKKYKK